MPLGTSQGIVPPVVQAFCIGLILLLAEGSGKLGAAADMGVGPVISNRPLVAPPAAAL